MALGVGFDEHIRGVPLLDQGRAGDLDQVRVGRQGHGGRDELPGGQTRFRVVEPAHYDARVRFGVDDRADQIERSLAWLVVRIGLEVDEPFVMAGIEFPQCRQVFFINVGQHHQLTEVGDLEQIVVGIDHRTFVKTLLDDQAVDGRLDFELGPGLVAVGIGPAKANVVSLVIDRRNLRLREAPRIERPQGACLSDHVSLDIPPRVDDLLLRNGPRDDALHGLQHLLVGGELRDGIDQFALFFADLFAPDDGHDVSLFDEITIPQRAARATFALPVVASLGIHISNLDQLSREPRVHAHQPIGIEHQRARQP